jgi:adenosylcobinamide-GDP ribazoletransferase
MLSISFAFTTHDESRYRYQPDDFSHFYHFIGFVCAKVQKVFVTLPSKPNYMQINIDQTRWYDRIWAALIFFTRLPFWRLHQPPKACYATVVEHWPLAGWITGGAMAATLYVASWYLPYSLAVLLAIIVRLLITGALHEDGLADFLDGFGGGGNNRERILAIMKDSHIGTYGVIGLILYELLLAAALLAMPVELAALTILAADPYAKMVTAQLVSMMPYARSEEEAKNKTVYRKMSWQAGVSLAIQGLLPMALYLWYTGIRWDLIIFIPALVMYFLYLLIWRKIRGYTGDCCGAVCLLVELTVYLVVCTQ